MDEFDRKKITFHITHDSAPSVAPTDIVHTAQNRFTKHEWIKILLSAGSAIVSGIILGIMILSFFNDSSVKVESKNTPQVYTYQINESTFYVLQLGVFSTYQNVKRAQDQFQSKFSSAVPLLHKKDGQHFQLYAGVSQNRKDAELWRAKYAHDETIPYIKSVVLPAEEIKTDKLVLVKQAEFRKESRRFATLLLRGEDHQAIRESHKTWTSNVQSLRQHAEFAVYEHSVHLMNQAFMAWAENQKHPHEQHQQFIQQNIMEVILSSKSI